MTQPETNTPPAEMTPPVQPQAPALSSIKTLFKETWAIYKPHWRISAVIQLITLLLMTLVPVALTLLGGLAINKFGTGLEFIIPATIIAGAVLSITLLTILALQAGQLLAFTEEAGASSLGTLYKRAQVFALPLLWANILTALVTFAGFVLLIVPGIIVTVSLVFVSFVVILDGYKGLDSLRASKEYVNGKWWAVAGRLALLSLIYLALTFILSFVFGALGLILQKLGVSFSGEISAWLLNIIYTAILTPLTVAYMYAIFKQIKTHQGTLALPKGGRATYSLMAVFGVIVIAALVAGGVWMQKSLSEMETRDQQRVIDIKLIQNKLELYSVENGRYPETLEAVGNFAAPTPNDGACSSEDNAYTYEKIEDSVYSLSFCLGSATGPFKAGKNEVPNKMEQELMRTLQD